MDTPESDAQSQQPFAVPPEPPAEPVVKRGRGRPRKIPLVEGAAPVPPATAAKKRGRPPKRAVYSDEAKSTLARQIIGLHLIASQATGIPELALSEPEAAMLAESVAAVSVEYGLSLSGKTGALIQLIAAAAMVYAPRFGAINKRVKQKKNTTPLHSVESTENAAAVN